MSKSHKNNKARDIATERAENFLGRWFPRYHSDKVDAATEGYPNPNARVLRALSKQFGLHVKAAQARARRKDAPIPYRAVQK